MAGGPQIVELSELLISETSAQFDGRDHGVALSFFVTNHPPGARIGLHTHPYEETFVLQAGRATFTVDGAEIEAHVGQVVIVPAGATHGFLNSGAEPLRRVTLHPADHVITEWLE